MLPKILMSLILGFQQHEERRSIVVLRHAMLHRRGVPVADCSDSSAVSAATHGRK